GDVERRLPRSAQQHVAQNADDPAGREQRRGGNASLVLYSGAARAFLFDRSSLGLRRNRFFRHAFSPVPVSWQPATCIELGILPSTLHYKGSWRKASCDR